VHTGTYAVHRWANERYRAPVKCILLHGSRSSNDSLTTIQEECDRGLVRPRPSCSRCGSCTLALKHPAGALTALYRRSSKTRVRCASLPLLAAVYQAVWHEIVSR
jgi:hypothetical protein